MQIQSKFADPLQDFVTTHLKLKTRPIRVPIVNATNARPNMCFHNTLSSQKNRGYKALLCWILYDYSELALEHTLFGRDEPVSFHQVQAELHAVLFVDNEIIDITPDENPYKRSRIIVLEPRLSVERLVETLRPRGGKTHAGVRNKTTHTCTFETSSKVDNYDFEELLD